MTERNLIWDELAVHCGQPQTKSERSDFGRTVKELKEINASLDDIAAFADWWMREMPSGVMITHRCYRNHWSKFKNGINRAQGTNGQPLTKSARTRAALAELNARDASRNQARPQYTGDFSRFALQPRIRNGGD